jgi:hypothetical protein
LAISAVYFRWCHAMPFDYFHAMPADWWFSLLLTFFAIAYFIAFSFDCHIFTYYYFIISILTLFRDYISLSFRAIFITPLRFWMMPLLRHYWAIAPFSARHIFISTFHYSFRWNISILMPPPLPFRHYYYALLRWLFLIRWYWLLIAASMFRLFHAIFIEFRWLLLRHAIFADWDYWYTDYWHWLRHWHCFHDISFHLRHISFIAIIDAIMIIAITPFHYSLSIRHWLFRYIAPLRWCWCAAIFHWYYFIFSLFDCLSLQIFSPISDDITHYYAIFSRLLITLRYCLADMPLMPAHAAYLPLMPLICHYRLLMLRYWLLILFSLLIIH